MGFTRVASTMEAEPQSEAAPEVHTNSVRLYFREYLDRISEDARLYEDFGAGRVTLFNMLIDFGNTIGCGATMQAALSFYE